MKDPEENTNYQEDNSRDSSRDSQDTEIGLERSLETIQMIDHMIEQEMVEMILNRNPTDIVNIVIKMVILGNIVGRCKPMQRKQEGLRRWMIEMMTHQTPLTPW